LAFKDKTKYEEWVKRYKRPYMQKYMALKRDQDRKLREHVQKGEWDLAKLLLDKKPSIDTSALRKRKRRK
jgi:hypothetical protein